MRPQALIGGALATLFAAAFAGSCNDDSALLRAKIIEERGELVGGPVAMADIGDYLLENDQIRVAILRPIDSPGPGVFGGSVVDIDRRRPRIEFQGGHGLDRFAESFPVANLMVPEPAESQVEVLRDGSDGERATIRVRGSGEFLFEALGVLRTQQGILDPIFPAIRTRLSFTTDYTVRPGTRHIRMDSIVRLPDEQIDDDTCPSLDDCSETCPDSARAEDPATGCVLCECSDVLALEQYDGPESVFGTILGDPPSEPDAQFDAGLIAGDFVFFGNQNDVFAPGPGFDEEAATQRAFRSGRNTFQEPLIYDFVAAAGGDISYGYFTVARPGGVENPVVNVPLFASAATAFVIGNKRCLQDAADDTDCDRNRAYSYTRYMAVGDGDVASVLEEVYKVRGTPTGEISGHVYWFDTGEPVPNARLYVLRDPDPGSNWADIDELVDANLALTGEPGVVNAMDADLGLDKVEDGDFRAIMPPGDYIVVARTADGVVTGAPIAAKVTAGTNTVIAPVLPTPASIRYRVSDGEGQLIPSKITVVSLDENGARLEGDGARRPYFGDGRLADGVRHLEHSAGGDGEMYVEPGRYDVIVSRGPEYALHLERDVTLAPGRVLKVDATLPQEVDTRGFMSADMHLHSTPSFDSGMPLRTRVRTVAADGVELAISTDHDVQSNYTPIIRELNLEPYVAHAVGAEHTTLEAGHFIGFPLLYDDTIVPNHGAHDWVCETGEEILDGIRDNGDGFVPFTILAHPRDGFFGYFDQLGVDSYQFTREPPLLEADNPVFRTAGCEFDGMEVIASKRFDMVRTASVIEIVEYNRCLSRIDTARDLDELRVACPELSSGLLLPCADDERFVVCQDRNRTEMAWRMVKRILTRTPTEQALNWAWPGTAEDTEAACNVVELGDDPIPQASRDLPCTFRSGQVDDYFRLIERGMIRTQIASSDSHNFTIEPGSPRTYFASETDDPGQLELISAVDSLRAGAAFATYGPFIRMDIDGTTFGGTVQKSAGAEARLALNIQTASWFGVDRIEIYLNGDLIEVFNPGGGPAPIVDIDTNYGFTVPDRDSWIVVIAMGLEDRNLMRPVSLSRQFGEIQLANIASEAFGLLPVINTIFPPDPVVPDWSPTPPYAVTNPIFIDTDGNGRYNAAQPFPPFCSQPCDTPGEQGDCPDGQVCLDPESVCGVDIVGRQCNRRLAMGERG